MNSNEDAITLSTVKFVTGDSTHVCRLCFVSTVGKDEHCLSDCVRLERPYFDQEITYMDMFGELGVNMESMLPDIICKDCATLTMNSFLFQRLCEYSDAKWMDALTRLDESLSKAEMIGPKVKTAFIVVKTDNHIMLTSKKTLMTKDKASALNHIQTMFNKRTKYVKMKKRNIVICEECGEHCSSIITLAKHIQKLHNSVKIPCRECAKYFSTRKKLEAHAERVHLQKTIQCSKCAQMFSTKQLLKRHESIHHIAAICKLCFVQLPSKNALRLHLDNHDVFKCEQCGKNYSNRQTYKLHLKVCGKPNVEPTCVICDICSKSYVRKNSLRTHLKIDHGFGNVLSCNWCNKKFDAASTLRNHIVKHTRERNFTCVQCDAKFVTQAALVYHVRLHTGERPYPCDLCDQSFLSASRRMEHKRRQHFGRTFMCSLCDSKFLSSFQTRKHMQRHYNPQSKLYLPEHAAAMTISCAVQKIPN